MMKRPVATVSTVATAIVLASCGGRSGTPKEARELAAAALNSGRGHYAAQLALAHGDVERGLAATDDYLSIAGAATYGLGDDEVASALTKDIVIARRVCKPCAARLEEAVREIRKPGKFGSTTTP